MRTGAPCARGSERLRGGGVGESRWFEKSCGRRVEGRGTESTRTSSVGMDGLCYPCSHACANTRSITLTFAHARTHTHTHSHTHTHIHTQSVSLVLFSLHCSLFFVSLPLFLVLSLSRKTKHALTHIHI